MRNTSAYILPNKPESSCRVQFCGKEDKRGTKRLEGQLTKSGILSLSVKGNNFIRI